MSEKINSTNFIPTVAPEDISAQQAADQAAYIAELQYTGTPEYPTVHGNIDIHNAIIHGEIRPDFDVVTAISRLLK